MHIYSMENVLYMCYEIPCSASYGNAQVTALVALFVPGLSSMTFCHIGQLSATHLKLKFHLTLLSLLICQFWIFAGCGSDTAVLFVKRQTERATETYVTDRRDFPRPGFVSLTFRELFNVFSSNCVLQKSSFLWDFQIESFNVCPKYGFAHT